MTLVGQTTTAATDRPELVERAPASADPIGIEEYRTLFRRHPAGVAVIALRHRGRPVGFTATSVISVSAAPPLLAFSLQATSSSWPGLREATTLAVSFLAAGQEDVSARFSASGVDRFASGGWHSLATGEPVIDGAAQWLRGTIVQRTDTGGSYLSRCRRSKRRCARRTVLPGRIRRRSSTTTARTTGSGRTLASADATRAPLDRIAPLPAREVLVVARSHGVSDATTSTSANGVVLLRGRGRCKH